MPDYTSERVGTTQSEGEIEKERKEGGAQSLLGLLLIPAALHCILVVVLWNYPCTNMLFLGVKLFFSFFFFFARSRKINVHKPNTIHHRLKAEVIQEMIAGEIQHRKGERESVRRIWHHGWHRILKSPI